MQTKQGLMSPTLQKMRFQAAVPFVHGDILDFGCGSGEILRYGADVKRYVGIDIDADALNEAKQTYPQHNFYPTLNDSKGHYDTVVALAVVEHVKDPEQLLIKLASLLKGNQSRIVLTTPHPNFEWIHYLGAKVGLFSREAADEHENLLDRTGLEKHCLRANLTITRYRRFLFGANQLVVMSPVS